MYNEPVVRENEGSPVSAFDRFAQRYDAWFESPEGRVLFDLEVSCLRSLIGEPEGRWLEIGVGTGRFAEALGIREGIDPSPAVLRFAEHRGIRTAVASGEDLPWQEATFDGLLLVVTICFLRDPARALRECARVLKPSGRTVVGLVPADSPWGRRYARLGAEGHPFYSEATFYTCDEIVDLARDAGLVLSGARSCLFDPPETSVTDPTIRDEIAPGAGFVAMDFVHPPGKRENGP